MSHVASSSEPGTVFIEPVRRPGPRRHFGRMANVQGYQSICIGYSTDGKTAVYVPVRQFDHIRLAVRSANNKPLYRLLKHIIAHYERRAV